ncbi:MAG: hypothetical protein DMF45_04675 [Verrucomicrobia bacterium]|nr:MAG: hypothetical protein DMF45_04675 [Verrucomicrobiota bacterium]
MAEVRTSTQSGELSQRFIEFVMMHAQNAALFLGQIPNPKTGEGEVNLELAKMFIDQLSMIQEKTRGNLTSEEAAVLRNTLSNLQMVDVEVAQQAPKGAAQPERPAPEPKPEASTKMPEQPPIAPSRGSRSELCERRSARLHAKSKRRRFRVVRRGWGIDS